jgi:uncharacterized membrane protein
VVAIIITIMVLEMKVPHGTDLASLRPLVPVFLSYVLSYVNVGIYWNNHHHLLHASQHVTGRVLWTNLLLLFWLSLFPFCTGWMGENHFAALPTAVYGVVLLCAAFSFLALQAAIVAADGRDSRVARAVGSDRKGLVSRLLYLAGIVGAFWRPWIGWACYVAVALIWFIPDRRIERVLAREEVA